MKENVEIFLYDTIISVRIGKINFVTEHRLNEQFNLNK